MVSLDKVDAIVANNWYILTNPLIPLAQQDKIIVISPTVMDASVESLCWDDAGGRANLAIWKDEVESRGITVVDTICEQDYSLDFRSQVTKCAIVGKPRAKLEF